MLGVKKIDIFVLKNFFLLFLGCFFICLFVFMMQFVWRYIDSLVGKGLGLDVLAQFFFYMSISLVPMALPMAILLTSLITFGNMGEQLELTAMKAAGIPLFRIMRSLIVSCVLLMCVSFYFQNTIGPKAQLELARMLISMKEKSPALEIPEGVFYNGIPNVNLYVEHKTAETGMLYNVIIYKMDQGIMNAQIVVADSAKLETTADKHFIKLSIYDGEQFENLQATNSSLLTNTQVPYDRETFQYKVLLIDFNTDFDLMNAEELNGMAETKSQKQLASDADSMTAVYDSIGRVNYADLVARYMQTGYGGKNDTLLAEKMVARINIDTILGKLPTDEKMRLLQRCATDIDRILTELEWRAPVSHDGYWMVRKHKIKWHEKYTNALSCLFFFFIGAPLGAIIRKGGLGISTIVSVLVFIIYYLIGISGMKMARDGTWSISYGMWISTVVMAPLGVWLTFKSNKDSAVLNLEALKERILMFVGYRPQRNMSLKEVIITAPNYSKARLDLAALSEECGAVGEALHLRSVANYWNIFFKPRGDNEVCALSDAMEQIIGELGNSDDSRIVYQLNDYPILYRTAHLSPIRKRWANAALGVIFPIGIVVWLKICKYRRRLNKDIARIIDTNTKLNTLIDKRLKAEANS